MNYNKTLAANRTDILITMIDCYNVGGCSLFGIRWTPHMTLVLGKKKRYWPVTRERGPEGWDRWINETMGPNLREISTEAELDSAKREPQDGGATFLLEVPDANNEFVDQLRTLSKSFRIYNDTFVFRVNASRRRPVIHAFYSEFCVRTYTGPVSGVKAFVDQNKFGVLHRYDAEEFAELQKQDKNAVILLTTMQPTESQMRSLWQLMRDHCGMDITVGWANVNDDPRILSMTKLKDSDVPLVYQLHKSTTASHIYKGKISEMWNSSFVIESHEGGTVSTFGMLSQYLVRSRRTVLFYVCSIVICYGTYAFRRESVSKLE